MVIKAIRWYLKGLFPIHIYLPLLSFIGFSQYYLISVLKNPIAFSTITQIFLIPIVMLSIASHFFRSKHITVFELTLIGSWRDLAVGKLVAFTIGLVPLMVLEFIVLWFSNSLDYLSSLLLTIVVYEAISLLASLAQAQMTAFMLDLVFILLLPIGAQILLGSYAQFHYTTGAIMGVIFYFLAPLVSYEYYKFQVVDVDPYLGLSIAFIIALLLIISYPYLFERSEFKP